tara:strand:+ start:3523 stop:4461 length:939 start_codon:yes stop_codon:yes gene_type:complete
MIRTLHALLAPLLLALIGLLPASVTAGDEVTHAAGFELQTPDGKTVRYPQDAQGQPSVLFFWPSWCPYSRAMQPYVQDIWEDYRDAGVKLWTINIREDGDPVQTMRDRKLSFPLLINGDALMQPYQITRTPWLVVMDAEQNIVYTRPADPPTPIAVAIDVRKALNKMLGDKAVPVPTTFPKPYDLHLKKKSDLVDRTAPKSIPTSEWVAWIDRYIGNLLPGEKRDDIAPRGAVQSGKEALALAKTLWEQAYGMDELRAQAPYRAFRRNNYWVVMGQGLDRQLGQGLVLVLEADSGQVIRMQASTASEARGQQ